jgi:circadian clock protein KaiC
MKDDRVASGVEGLDDLIGGGFRQGKNYLICGETGTGRSTLSLQFLLNGTAHGEAGVYVTADETPGELLEDARAIGFNASMVNAIGQKKLAVLDYSAHFDQIVEKQRDIDVRKIVGDLNRYVKEIDAKRLVIDPITSLIVKEGKLWEVRSYIRSFFYALNGLGTTNLLCSSIPSGSHRLSEYGIEEFYASGILALSVSRSEMVRSKRTIVVQKMRGSAHELDPYTYEFVQGKGIVVRQRCFEIPFNKWL